MKLHGGSKPTYKLINQYFHDCDACAARKPSQTQNKAPLGSYVVGQPMERVSIDVVGPFRKIRKGNQYILTICDCFTKWIEVCVCDGLRAAQLSQDSQYFFTKSFIPGQ
jgi:hypothetical protein